MFSSIEKPLLNYWTFFIRTQLPSIQKFKHHLNKDKSLLLPLILMLLSWEVFSHWHKSGEGRVVVVGGVGPWWNCTTVHTAHLIPLYNLNPTINCRSFSLFSLTICCSQRSWDNQPTTLLLLMIVTLTERAVMAGMRLLTRQYYNSSLIPRSSALFGQMKLDTRALTSQQQNDNILSQ